MKYYVLTEAEESGPYSAATLNRMFQKGQVRADQLCREEGSQQTRRLDEVFRHFSPSKEVVLEARKNVSKWNQQAGAASTSLGIGFLTFGILRAVMRGNIFSGVALLIVGIGLVVNGVAQRRRGDAAAANLPPDPPAPSPAAKEEGPPRTYDY